MTFDMRSGNLHWNNILTGISSLRRPAREMQQKIQTNCQLFFPLWRLGTSHPSYTLDSNERRSTQKRRQPCFYWARAGKIHSFFLIVSAKFLFGETRTKSGGRWVYQSLNRSGFVRRCELIVHIRHSSGMLGENLTGGHWNIERADTLLEDGLTRARLHSQLHSVIMSRKGLFKLFNMVPWPKMFPLYFHV